MKVKMLEDAPGSPDGVTVNDYAKGETYDVPADLADTFVRYELAEVVESESEDDDERVVIDLPPLGSGKRAAAPSENK